jgi:hypothetical protein
MSISVVMPAHPLHRCARFLYCLSLLFLLSGTWVLIDPLGRRCGETLHIYITLAAFEVYIWLLLGLARWQLRRTLTSDTVRSGAFLTLLLVIAGLLMRRRWLFVLAAGPGLMLGTSKGIEAFCNWRHARGFALLAAAFVVLAAGAALQAWQHRRGYHAPQPPAPVPLPKGGQEPEVAAAG